MPISLLRCALFAALISSPLPLFADAGIEQQIQRLDEKISSSPQDQNLYIQRSLAHFNNNQPSLALADIKTAESVDNPVNAAFVHGILLYRSAEFEKAKGYFDLYLAAFPRHPASLQYRARVLRDSGDYTAALLDYELLFSIRSRSDPGNYLAAAQMMAALPERGTDDALTLLDDRMKVTGVLSSLQRYAIKLEIDRQHYEAAIQRLGTLDQKLRATPQWQLEVAELYLLAGKPEQALPHLELAAGQINMLRPSTMQRELQQRQKSLMSRATTQ
ncbi:MAG: hypothetical protein V7754_18815 [Halioglobus sp.]